MPSLSRRREIDLRSDRLESEVRVSEIGRIDKRKKGLPYCEYCQRAFEEPSLYCPRCDRKTMGWVRPIPEEYIETVRRKNLESARRKIGL